MIRSTAKTDWYHNWMARDARKGCDFVTRRQLDKFHEWQATNRPWEFWFEHGDEVV